MLGKSTTRSCALLLAIILLAGSASALADCKANCCSKLAVAVAPTIAAPAVPSAVHHHHHSDSSPAVTMSGCRAVSECQPTLWPLPDQRITNFIKKVISAPGAITVSSDSESQVVAVPLSSGVVNLSPLGHFNLRI
jgi:hypothetical protein